MNAKVKIFSIIFSIFDIILGTLLHFTYEWSNKNIIVSLFSSINESTWEHLKLVFFPMLLTSIIGYFALAHPHKNYWCSRAIGISTAMIFIIVFFYTYSGIFGKNIALIDISSFIISVIIGEYTAYTIQKNSILCNNKTAITFLIALTISFVLFTFNPPKIGLFKNPIDGSYGLKVKKI